MRVRREGQETDRYYIEGGFVEVLGDVVSVLTQRAVPAAEIDTAVAREQLLSARCRRSATPEAAAVRDRVVAQSRAGCHRGPRAVTNVEPSAAAARFSLRSLHGVGF